MRHRQLIAGALLLVSAPLAGQQEPVTPKPAKEVLVELEAVLAKPVVDELRVALAELERVPALAAAELEAVHAELVPALAEAQDLAQVGALRALEVLDALEDLELEIDVRVSPLPGEGTLPPAAWAPQDPADSLWRAARRAINDGDYERAARLYFQLHENDRYRNSEYRGQAYYWEAFARARVGGQAELRRARAALEAMRTRHADDWRAQRDAAALLTRVNTELAQRGDARAAAAVQAHVAAAARTGCDEESMATKVAAMNALLQVDAEQAMPVLEEVMKKRDACSAELRRKAIFLISQKHSERAQELILDAVRNDPDPEVQQQAVFWLSQVSGEASLRALEQILSEQSTRRLHEHALFALSQHRSDRATELLRSYAQRQDLGADLRKHAIFALGQRQGEANAALLMELYPRLEPELREMVIFSVGQQPDARADAWLMDIVQNDRENIEVRKHAMFWLSQRGAVDVARLTQMYERMPSRELKEQVIFVLAQKQDAAAVDRLMQIARSEKDPELRKQAIFWLGQSRDPRAARFLVDIIGN